MYTVQNVPPQWSQLGELKTIFLDLLTARKFSAMIATLIEVRKIAPNDPWFLTMKKHTINILLSRTSGFQNTGQYNYILLVAKTALQLDPTLSWAQALQSLLDTTYLKAQVEKHIDEKNYIEALNNLKIIESIDPNAPWLQELRTKVVQLDPPKIVV